jgi:ribonuclease BN (tRNA processing enzyme)
VKRPALWLPPGGTKRLRDHGERMSFAGQIDDAFDVREYEDDVTFDAAGFSVTPHRLDHYSELTFGLRVQNHNGTLAYSGDTGPSHRLVELAKSADVFLCEATLREPEPAERGHLSEDEALDAFRASGAKRLVVIHRPDELPLSPDLVRAADGDVFTI